MKYALIIVLLLTTSCQTQNLTRNKPETILPDPEPLQVGWTVTVTLNEEKSGEVYRKVYITNREPTKNEHGEWIVYDVQNNKNIIIPMINDLKVDVKKRYKQDRLYIGKSFYDTRTQKYTK